MYICTCIEWICAYTCNAFVPVYAIECTCASVGLMSCVYDMPLNACVCSHICEMSSVFNFIWQGVCVYGFCSDVAISHKEADGHDGALINICGQVLHDPGCAREEGHPPSRLSHLLGKRIEWNRGVENNLIMTWTRRQKELRTTCCWQGKGSSDTHQACRERGFWRFWNEC